MTGTLTARIHSLEEALREVEAEESYDPQLGCSYRCPICKGGKWVRGNEDPTVLSHKPGCLWLEVRVRS